MEQFVWFLGATTVALGWIAARATARARRYRAQLDRIAEVARGRRVVRLPEPQVSGRTELIETA